MYIQHENRRARRDYRNYYKKATHQRQYIAQIGRWLGYSYEMMKSHFIYPGGDKKLWGTSKVVYHQGRYKIADIKYPWDTRELIRELIRVKATLGTIPDVAYRQEAKRWFRWMVFRAWVYHYRIKISGRRGK